MPYILVLFYLIVNIYLCNRKSVTLIPLATTGKNIVTIMMIIKTTVDIFSKKKTIVDI